MKKWIPFVVLFLLLAAMQYGPRIWQDYQRGAALREREQIGQQRSEALRQMTDREISNAGMRWQNP